MCFGNQSKKRSEPAAVPAPAVPQKPRDSSARVKKTAESTASDVLFSGGGTPGATNVDNPTLGGLQDTGGTFSLAKKRKTGLGL